jgi:hypothetical protein
MKNVLAMCFDRRVLLGLGVVAAGVWVVAPQYVLGALPLLLLAACPLSMLFMARMTMRGPADAGAKDNAVDRLTALEREQEQLAGQISRARAEVGEAAPVAGSREA